MQACKRCDTKLDRFILLHCIPVEIQNCTQKYKYSTNYILLFLNLMSTCIIIVALLRLFQHKCTERHQRCIQTKRHTVLQHMDKSGH